MLIALVVGALTRSPKSKNTRSFNYPIKQEYSCVQYDQNHIQLYGDPTSWNLMLASMSQMAFEGEGKLDVLHIGGSHVQGGFLSDKLRNNLIELFYGAQGERGFFFPYQLAKTNGQRSVKCDFTGTWTSCRNAVADHHCDWGMSGINATTYLPDARFSITTMHKDSLLEPFSEVRIYSSCGDTTSFAYQVARGQLDSASLTASYRRYTFSEPQTSLEVNLLQTDSNQNHFTLQGIYLGASEHGVSYHTIGVNGASTHSYLRCTGFAEQIKSIAPDLVICGIGVNDANVPADDFDSGLYMSRYDSLINSFKAANPSVCLLFVTNNDTYYQKRFSNPNAIKIRDCMISLATKHGGGVYDLYAVMGGANSIRSWADAGLAAHDYIHFSKRGYELQADMMTAAIAELLGDYLARTNP